MFEGLAGARWRSDAIAEEILFHDNAEFMKQLGLALRPNR
jgi:hypothetical protein